MGIIPQKLKRKELLIVILVTVLVALLATSLFLYRETKAPVNYEHVPVTKIDAADIFVYFSNIEQVSQGNFQIKNLYTSEDQPGGIANPVWWQIGTAGNILNLSTKQIYYVSKIFWIIAASLSIYLFISLFIQDLKWRLLSWTIGIFATGLSAFVFINQNYPLAGIRETIPWLAFLYGPNGIASLAFLFFIFYLIAKGKWTYIVIAAALTSVLVLFHTYTAVLVVAVFVVYHLLFLNYRKIFWNWPIFFAIITPAFYYQLLTFTNNQGLKVWFSQNVTLSPSPGFYILTFIFLLPFAALGIWRIIATKETKYNFLLAWLITFPFIIYSPLNFQRRLGEGFSIPLAIISTLGLIWLFKRFYFANRSMFKMGLVALLGLIITTLSYTNIKATNSLAALNPPIEPPYYLSSDLIAGCHWLKENTPKNRIVLSSEENGMIIPAISGRKVFLGHRHQTGNYKVKSEDVNRFMDDKINQAEASSWLGQNEIDYIFDTIDKNSRDLDLLKNVEKVYSNPEVDIFKVL